MTDSIDTDMASTINRENINSSYEKFNFDKWVVEKLSPRTGMSILDIGFGGGKQIKLMMDKVLPKGKICGIDLSAECVANILKLLDRYDNGNIEIIQGNMDDAPSVFSGKEFDLIFSVYAFYYSSDMVRLLNRLNKLLVGGGKMCIFGYGRKSNEQMIDIINSVSDCVVPSYNDFISEDQIYKSSISFSSVKAERFSNIIRFPDKDRVMSWFRSSELYKADLFEEIGAAIDKVIISKSAFELTKETLCVTFEK